MRRILHGDHLGSVAVSNDSNGNILSSQEYKPWGGLRSGNVAHTKINYTGPQKDYTGLLHYLRGTIIRCFVSAYSAAIAV